MKCEHVIAKIGPEITICGKPARYELGERKDGTPSHMNKEKICGIHALFWSRRGIVVKALPKPYAPSPRAIYAIDEIVEVTLPTPTGGHEKYQARVIARSRMFVTIRVAGTGTEIALPKWTARQCVRRLPPPEGA